MIKNISFLAKLKTYFRLGIINILRVTYYRLSLKIRTHPVQYIKADIPTNPFFRKSERQFKIPPEIKDWNNSILLFGWFRKQIDDKIPDWFKNPFLDFASENIINTKTDWWNIPDFGKEDIKCIWELSRFNWAVAFSTKIANGNEFSLKKLNHWLKSWAKANPPYKGPNWKCGQECSIRVINLIISAWILGQDHTPERGLIEFIKIHLQRIDKTLSYAIAQQNNHATSEAAALFMGGVFLHNYDKRASRWESKGRRLLEHYTSSLIESDGSFSQYSLNYHRVMLDTYSLVEAWRRYRVLGSFSKNFSKKLKLATEWLWTFVDFENGNVPNIGANDGAQILQLSRSDFCDYRPSIQLAATLFMKIDVFGNGTWDEPLYWLNVKKGVFNKNIVSKTFSKGGYHVLRKDQNMVILNYPKFSFRPSQADALHVDLWSNGRNLFRDGGTFNYNSNLTKWFSSTAAHNTIEFDGRNQMPQISRFLFGNWPETKNVDSIKIDEDCISASATYKDYQNNYHKRSIILYKNKFICIDKIQGTFKEACLRWRLIPKEWKLKDKIFMNDNFTISVEVNNEPVVPILDETLESLYYNQQNKVPLLSVKVNKPSILITKFTF